MTKFNDKIYDVWNDEGKIPHPPNDPKKFLKIRKEQNRLIYKIQKREKTHF